MIQIDILNKLLWAFGFADATVRFVNSCELRNKVRDIERNADGEIVINGLWFHEADLPIIVRALIAIKGGQAISNRQLEEAVEATQKVNLPSTIEQQVGAILFQLDASDELKAALGRLLTAAFNNVSVWSINMVSARAKGNAMTVFEPVRAYMDPPGRVNATQSPKELSAEEIEEFDAVLDDLDEADKFLETDEDDEYDQEFYSAFPGLPKIDDSYRGWSFPMADIIVSKKGLTDNIDRWFDDNSTVWGSFLLEICDVADKLGNMDDTWVTAVFSYVTELTGNQLEHAIRDTYDAYESRTAVGSLMPDDPIKCSSIRAELDRVMSYSSISKLRPPLDEHIRHERSRGSKRFIEAFVTTALDIRNIFGLAILNHDPKSK